MAVEVLGMIWSPGVNQQPVRVLNGAINTFGNVIPVAPPDGNNDANPFNAVTNGMGGVGARLGNEFYMIVTPTTGTQQFNPGSIYVYDPSTSNWITAGNGFVPAVSDAAITNMKIGLNSSGVPRAFALQGNTSSSFAGRIIYRDLGGAPGWIQSTIVSPFPGAQPFKRLVGTGVLYRNQLHWCIGGRAFTADPTNLSFAVQTLSAAPASDTGKSILGVVQGRLFVFDNEQYRFAATTPDYLWEFTGSWVQRINGNTPGIVSNLATFSGWSLAQNSVGSKPVRLNARRAVIFEDPATRDMALLFYEDPGTAERGLRVMQVNLNTFTPTEVSGTVAPGAIAFPTGPAITGGNVTPVDMVLNFDTLTDPANPSVTIGILLNNGTYTWYQWNGFGAAMINVGSGQTINSNITHVDSNGGGENVYEGSSTAAPALYVHEVGRVALQGESRILLQGFAFDETGGSPSTPNRDVELLYSRTFGGSPTSPTRNKCTLAQVGKDSGPGATPTLSGGNVTGMDFDNGATTVFADWEAINDGLFKGEQHNLMPRVLP